MKRKVKRLSELKDRAYGLDGSRLRKLKSIGITNTREFNAICKTKTGLHQIKNILQDKFIKQIRKEYAWLPFMVSFLPLSRLGKLISGFSVIVGLIASGYSLYFNVWLIPGKEIVERETRDIVTSNVKIKILVCKFGVSGGIPQEEGNEIALNLCNDINAFFFSRDSLGGKAWMVPDQGNTIVLDSVDARSIGRRLNVDIVIWGSIRQNTSGVGWNTSGTNHRAEINILVPPSFYTTERVITFSNTPVIKNQSLKYIPCTFKLMIGEIFMFANHFKKAVTLLEEGLQECGNNLQTEHELCFMIAQCYHFMNDYLAAKHYYRKALELVPKFADAHAWLAILFLSEYPPQIDSAIGEVGAATQITPQTIATQYSRGLYYSNTGNLELAERSFHDAISADPDWLIAYPDLAEVYIKQGAWVVGADSIERMKSYRKATTLLLDVRRRPGFRATTHYYSMLGLAYAYCGVFDSSMIFYYKALEGDSANGQVKFSILRLYSVQGWKEQFFKQFENWSLPKKYLVEMADTTDTSTASFSWFAPVRRDPRFNAILKKKGISF